MYLEIVFCTDKRHNNSLWEIDTHKEHVVFQDGIK